MLFWCHTFNQKRVEEELKLLGLYIFSPLLENISSSCFRYGELRQKNRSENKRQHERKIWKKMFSGTRAKKKSIITMTFIYICVEARDREEKGVFELNIDIQFETKRRRRGKINEHILPPRKTRGSDDDENSSLLYSADEKTENRTEILGKIEKNPRHTSDEKSSRSKSLPLLSSSSSMSFFPAINIL